MTYGRAMEVASVCFEMHAAVSHGLTSSPQWGEASAGDLWTRSSGVNGVLFAARRA
jgi:hypothetical protein